MVIFLCDYGGQVPNMLQAQLKKENEMSRKKKCTHTQKKTGKIQLSMCVRVCVLQKYFDLNVELFYFTKLCAP